MATTFLKLPDEVPYFPVDQAFQLKSKPEALSFLYAHGACANGLCDIPVEVGLFFDGTNNNMARDLNGERVAVVSEEAVEKIKSRAKASGKNVSELMPPVPPSISRPLPDMARGHSNVARLYRAFPQGKRKDGLYGFYIQGVGTPFAEIGELTESAEGKAFAKGGQARIIWGLLQVLNAIHATVADQSVMLYDDKVVGELALAYGGEVGKRADISDPESPTVTHQDW